MISSLRRFILPRSDRISKLPILILMPYGGCNCRCLMCDLWKGSGNPSALSAADLARLAPALRNLHVRQVLLTGGEPLMHPDLWGLCAALRPLAARITLLSNGLLLARHAQEIVRWCREVIVSLDGPRGTHDAIRGVPGAYDQLREGVAVLRSANPSMRITGRCVMQRRNSADLIGTVRAAREIGLDQISFLAADVSTAAFGRETPWTCDRIEEIALTAAEAEELARGIEELIGHLSPETPPGFVAEGPEKLRRLAAHCAAWSRGGPYPVHSCNAPWVSAVIEADGAVRPCFFHAPVGRLGDGPLDEILNSREGIAFRRGLDPRRDPVCRTCTCTLLL
jgi:Fe-coproporphyrin III synthase